MPHAAAAKWSFRARNLYLFSYSNLSSIKLNICAPFMIQGFSFVNFVGVVVTLYIPWWRNDSRASAVIVILLSYRFRCRICSIDAYPLSKRSQVNYGQSLFAFLHTCRSVAQFRIEYFPCVRFAAFIGIYSAHSRWIETNSRRRHHEQWALSNDDTFGWIITETLCLSGECRRLHPGGKYVRARAPIAVDGEWRMYLYVHA